MNRLEQILKKLNPGELAHLNYGNPDSIEEMKKSVGSEYQNFLDQAKELSTAHVFLAERRFYIREMGASDDDDDYMPSEYRFEVMVKRGHQYKSIDKGFISEIDDHLVSKLKQYNISKITTCDIGEGNQDARGSFCETEVLNILQNKTIKYLEDNLITVVINKDHGMDYLDFHTNQLII
ncbi:hypothetical protein KY334_07870 [Candidatus Woesearchaeota archaeon]|nr:hypothetical protein [Candidatus Woesearchaeota archaeon]